MKDGDHASGENRDLNLKSDGWSVLSQVVITKVTKTEGINSRSVGSKMM